MGHSARDDAHLGFVERLKFRWERKAFPILRPARRHIVGRLYVGLPGSGKSLLMVRDAIRAMRRGVYVISNMRIVDPINRRNQAHVVASWDEVVEVLHTVRARDPERAVMVCIDEMHLWADARDWRETPKWLLVLFAERRHVGLSIAGTTQVVEQVEIRLRNLCDEIVTCAPSLPRRILQGLGRDLPLFTVKWLDRGLEAAESDDPYIKTGWTWAPWWAYEGYSTEFLTAPPPRSEADLIELLRDLTDRLT